MRDIARGVPEEARLEDLGLDSELAARVSANTPANARPTYSFFDDNIDLCSSEILREFKIVMKIH